MSAGDPLAHGLPHRAPFLFVDGVKLVAEGERAEGWVTWQPGEPFFAGHFPGDPLVPGVILAEALAQIAGIAAGRPPAGKSYRLAALRQMKFLRPVRPGDRVDLRAERVGSVGGLHQFSAVASVKGEPAAEGLLVLAEA